MINFEEKTDCVQVTSGAREFCIPKGKVKPVYSGNTISLMEDRVGDENPQHQILSITSIKQVGTVTALAGAVSLTDLKQLAKDLANILV